MREIGFRRGLGIVLAVALALRLGAIAATGDFAPVTDGLDFDRHAVVVAEAGDYPFSAVLPWETETAFRPPAFPLTLAAAYEVVGTGDEEARWLAGRILLALLGTVAVALAALVARRVWGETVGLVTGLLCALHPVLVMVGVSLMSESLYIPLVLGAVLAALRREGLWPAAAAGALAGLAALTRSNGLVLVLPLAWLVWTGRPRRSWAALQRPLLLIAAVLVVLAPWTVRNAVVLDAFVPVSTQGGFALAGTFNEQARNDPRFPALWRPADRVPSLDEAYADPTRSEPEVSSELRKLAMDYAVEHPGYALEVVAHGTLRLLNLEGPAIERFLAPYEGYPVRLAVGSVYAFWILGLVAAAGATTRLARRAPRALWWVPFLTAASAVLFGLTRYRSPADPFLAMLAACALVTAAERLLASRR